MGERLAFSPYSPMGLPAALFDTVGMLRTLPQILNWSMLACLRESTTFQRSRAEKHKKTKCKINRHTCLKRGCRVAVSSRVPRNRFIPHGLFIPRTRLIKLGHFSVAVLPRMHALYTAWQFYLAWQFYRE